MATEIITLDMNRVEGDLEIRLQVTDSVVEDAWCIGTMYRGFEQLLMGRAARDGLVITPRVCGICGTAHQYCAVAAIETAYNFEIAASGTRIRNLCSLAEEVQSDMRHSFLMFAIDFCNERYARQPLYPQLVEAFEPLRGRVYRETIEHTKEILKVVALFGGQWPHSTFMVPGGVTCVPDPARILHALALIDRHQRWYEGTVLGCSLERWSQNHTLDDLLAWIDESTSHRDSAMGLFIRFGRHIGLQRAGQGNGNLLSFGSCFDPEAWQPPFSIQTTWRPAGFYDADSGQVEPLDTHLIAEHVRHSYFRDYEGARHPYEGETVPDYLPGTEKYSWAKAPRYRGKVVEVGPLADQVCAGDPLVRSMFAAEGSNSWLRQFTRLHRPSHSLPFMRDTLTELLRRSRDPYVINHEVPLDYARGMGAVQAARGGLAHWVEFDSGKISRYQIITPTSWNASPRDSSGVRGHWEESVIGTVIEDIDNPVELGHIIRSHDACLVCTVHVLGTKHKHRYGV